MSSTTKPSALPEADLPNPNSPELPAAQGSKGPGSEADVEGDCEIDADTVAPSPQAPISVAKTAAEEALEGYWYDDRVLDVSTCWSSLPPRDTGSSYERRSELTMTVRGRAFLQPEAWAFTEAYLKANLYLEYSITGVHTERPDEVANNPSRPAYDRERNRPERFAETITLAPFTSQYQPAHPEVRINRVKPGEMLEGAVRVDLSRAQLNRRIDRARSYLDLHESPTELPPRPFELGFQLFGSDRCNRVQTALETMLTADDPLFVRFALADAKTAVRDTDYSLSDDESAVSSAGDRVLSLLFTLGMSSITRRYEYLDSIPEDLREQVSMFTWQEGLNESRTAQFVHDAETALEMDNSGIVE